MTKKLRFFAIFLLLFQISFLNAQVKVKELPLSEFHSEKLDFISNNQYRNTVLLSKNWRIFLPDSEEPKATVKIPSIFSGINEIVYRKSIKLTKEELSKHHYRLHFLGINYSAEIYVNGQILYKVPSGNIPVTVDIPDELLTADSKNVLNVIVNHKLDSENTIPTKQSFLAPYSAAGILREVYIQAVPKHSVGKTVITTDLNNSLSNGTINARVQVQNTSPDKSAQYSLSFLVTDLNGNTVSSINGVPVYFNNKEEVSIKQTLNVSNPVLWSPEAPATYKLKTILLVNGSPVDEVFNTVNFFRLNVSDNGITLNNQPFTIKGVVYHPAIKDYYGLVSYERIKKDLLQIKNTGFNTVRFTRQIPPVAALNICSELGLMVLLEIPLNNIPFNIIGTGNYRERTSRYASFLLESLKNYYSIGAIGIGSGFIANNPEQNEFLSGIANQIKRKSNKLVFASFSNIPQNEISSIDLYGIELFAKPAEKLSKDFKEPGLTINKNKLFISEATYPVFKGSTNGYKNENSFEAQAKYFEDLITFTQDRGLGGLVINSMYDYRGDFSPFSTGYSEDNIIQIGLVGENRVSERLAYKVVRSKLNKEEKITIPMGYKKDDTPLFFIIIGIILGCLLAVLFNAKRKFREDAMRALLRPYNFYADIRDQRILSGFHSNFLMIVLSSSFALVACNISFFLRTDPFIERFLISFGSNGLVGLFSYLAWNPLQAFFYYFIICSLTIILISVLIQTTSFFVKTKVLFSSVYYTVTWSFLPYAIILPAGVILYRILSAHVANEYVIGILFIFKLWILQRVIKGIYVIFDVRASKVYFYSILVLLFVTGSILLYFQMSESTVDYIINAYNHFSL